MTRFVGAFQGFANKYLNWMNIPRVGWQDIVEVIIITIVLYHVIVWIKSTRAWSLMKGLIVLLLFVLVAAIFQMNTILWIAGKTFNVGIIALLVVFQPELRSALERLGRRQWLLSPMLYFENGKNTESSFSEKTKRDLVRACFEMGAVKTGALIVIEREVSLAEYERTGIELDAAVSAQLTINIFEKNTPLHDGAVIMRGDRFVSATCYLPLSDNMLISKELGTRHRAALGISEVSDSFTIIVSEETGAVSVAQHGKIQRDLTREELDLALERLRNPSGPPRASGKMSRKWRGKNASEVPSEPKSQEVSDQ